METLTNGNSVKLTNTFNRSVGIGGSDVPAILGIDKFRTPFDVWNEKVNNISTPESYIMSRGKFLEEFIAQKFAQTYNYEVRPLNKVLKDPTIPYFFANVDRIYSNGSIQGVLECKHTTQFIDEPQKAHFVQLQWYLGITNLQYGAIAYDTPYEFKVFEFAKDNDFIEYLRQEATKFWENYVLTKTPPPAITIDDVRQIYAEENPGQVIEANVDIIDLVSEIKRLEGKKKEIDNEIDNLKAQIMNFMGNSDTLVYEGKPIATWKSQTSTRLDTTKLKSEMPDIYNKYCNTQQVRVFRIK